MAASHPFDWLTGFPGANEGRAFSPGPGQVCDLQAVTVGEPIYPGQKTFPDLVRAYVGIETIEADLKEAKRRVSAALVGYLDETWPQGYDREANEFGRRFRVTAVPLTQPQYDPERLLEQMGEALAEGIVTRTQATAIVTTPPGQPRIDRDALGKVLEEAPALAAIVKRAEIPRANMNRNLRVQQILPGDRREED